MNPKRLNTNKAKHLATNPSPPAADSDEHLSWRAIERTLGKLESHFGLGDPILPRDDISDKMAQTLLEKVEKALSSGVKYRNDADRNLELKRFEAIKNTIKIIKHKALFKAKSEPDSVSQKHQQFILKKCISLGYSERTKTVSYEEPATFEQMKERERRLREAMLLLDFYGAKILPYHKTECFRAIQKIREHHASSWQKLPIHERDRKQDPVVETEQDLARDQQRHEETVQLLTKLHEQLKKWRHKLSRCGNIQKSQGLKGLVCGLEKRIANAECERMLTAKLIEEGNRLLLSQKQALRVKAAEAPRTVTNSSTRSKAPERKLQGTKGDGPEPFSYII